MHGSAIVILSVRPSVCLSHWWSTPKRFNISKYFVHHTIEWLFLVFLMSNLQSRVQVSPPVKVSLVYGKLWCSLHSVRKFVVYACIEIWRLVQSLVPTIYLFIYILHLITFVGDDACCLCGTWTSYPLYEMCFIRFQWLYTAASKLWCSRHKATRCVYVQKTFSERVIR